ncbi:hypothetical protein D3C85_1600090 [compost metagenome]
MDQEESGTELYVCSYISKHSYNDSGLWSFRHPERPHHGMVQIYSDKHIGFFNTISGHKPTDKPNSEYWVTVEEDEDEYEVRFEILEHSLR